MLCPGLCLELFLQLFNNVQYAFVQLAASFGIKFMETSAKANINIENVSTAAFLLYFLSSLCKPAVWDAGLHGWVVEHFPAAETLAGGGSVALGLRKKVVELEKEH